MTDFIFSKSDRFSDDFSIFSADGYELTVAETAYLSRVNRMMDELADTEMRPEELAEELQAARARCAQYVLRRVRDFVDLPSGPGRNAAAEEELEAIIRADGIHADRRGRILMIPFVVHTVPSEPERPVIDVAILIRDAPISEDKQRFKVEIDHSITVIKAVLGERSQGRSFLSFKSNMSAQDVAQRLDEYLYAVAGIARVGLMNLDQSQTPFAKLALQSLQGEFVAREAGIVKNSYVMRLGIAAIVVLFIGGIGYVSSYFFHDYLIYRFREFFLLSCGAAIGTWLSFSIRHVSLSFSDLAAIEEDRLNPGVRMLFMVSLTFVIGMLLWTGAVVIKIGEFQSDFAHHGMWATLIGAMCGIAERAMTTAVSKRAQDFAAGLGGLTHP